MIEQEKAPISENGGAAQHKKLFIKGIMSGIIGIVVVVLVVGAVAAYRMPDKTPIMPAIFSALHVPVATVGGTIITWKDLKIDSEALALYLSKSGSPTELGGDSFRTRVLHRQILTIAAEKFAAEVGVSITSADLDKQLDAIASANGGKDKIAADIKANFGWTYEQYRDRVVKSMLVLQSLQTKLLSDDAFIAPARGKAEAALAEVRAGKKDFAEIAKAVSEDSSAAAGGELGFMKRGDTVPEFDKALFSMKKGEVSGLIKTEFGYHIIKIEEIKKDAKGVTTEVRAQHILVKYPSVIARVQEWLDHASVHQFIKTEKPARADANS